MSQYDTKTLHEFIMQTPESGLRKMLVDKVRMTDVHFNLLLKVARGCTVDQFDEHFSKSSFPRLRFGPAEEKIKEKFWKDCESVLLERGILQPAMPQKLAS